MTKDEALKLGLEALEAHADIGIKSDKAINAIKEALAQPEPVKIAHKHEWFRTGEMKVGQMRCISCGTWGQEEIPQRKPLTDEEINQIADDFIVDYRIPAGSHYDFARAIETAHGIKETEK